MQARIVEELTQKALSLHCLALLHQSRSRLFAIPIEILSSEVCRFSIENANVAFPVLLSIVMSAVSTSYSSGMTQ